MTEDIQETAPGSAESQRPAAPLPPANALYRARVVYARREALRYVSHLEMQQVWERTLRRAGVPLAYTQGFNPHPRIHLASALPLGFLSRCEISDFWMNLPADAPAPHTGDLAARIQAAAPPGLALEQVDLVPLNLPPLQTQVIAAEYVAAPYDPIGADALSQQVSALLSQSSLPRERRGKPYDLRALIEALDVLPGEPTAPSAARLFMRLTAREGATGRPEELLDALGLDAAAFRVERIALILLETD